MFGWVDFREDGKKKNFGECLVEGKGGKKNWWGSGVYSPDKPKCFHPKFGRNLKGTKMDKSALV